MGKARFLAHYLFTRGRTHRYGPERSQRGDLHLPPGDGPHPVIVLIHGGSWRKRYGRRVMRALAADLLARGFAVWNVEYRRVGEPGGGWPATFADVAAAIDHLEGLSPALDLADVQAIGHSAGGHLALWAAGRDGLPAGAPGAVAGRSRVRLRRVVSLAGVCDLTGAYAQWHGGAVRELMGGSPERLPDRYAVADPLRRVPLPIPALLVHGVADETVSVRLSRRYAEAAAGAGGEVELVEIEGPAGEHRAFIYPGGAAWGAVAERLRPEVPARAT
ncbi:MAG TPA: alpha/beta hydrolase [Solirubrobacteraceae bacterium]|nr:alpha/beta hydrolase [Solirubrobacteraceae bacterium]